MSKMFKQFINEIVDCENHDDAFQNVFYGTVFNDDGKIEKYGIDIAFQHEKISWDEHQLLLKIINKMK